MIDIKKLIEERKTYEAKLHARDSDINITPIIETYTLKQRIQEEEQELQEKLNKNSKLLDNKDKDSNEFKLKREELREISTRISELTNSRKSLDEKLRSLLLTIPNIIQDDVPISSRKEDSIEVYRFGSQVEHDFTTLDHVTLATTLGIIDFERGAKIAQRGFPLYVGKGAMLELALTNFMIQHHINNGFTFIMPPILNNTASLTMSGNLPKFADQIYSCRDDDLHLIPTSEVPLTAMLSAETVSLESGPKRYVAYSPNFRREAGTHGKRDKGLIRTHQFYKLETYSLCMPQSSNEELEFLVTNSRALLEKLNLHYRIANLPSCDLAMQSSKTYDLEIWLPHQKRYSEVSSGSNCTDYQARRADIKFKSGNSKSFVHTLNCSGLATSRVMVALLETYQDKDGHVTIPEVLIPFTGFDKI